MDYFNDILSIKDLSYPYAYLLCESADNLQVFKKEKASSLAACIRKINEGLNEGKKKLIVSLAKLLILLPQCPQSVLSSEGERWIRFCYQNLNHPKSLVVKSCLNVIKFLLRACHGNKELLNKVNKVNMSFVERLYSFGSEVCPEVQESALHCLYELLRLFPSQCLSHKKRIEEKLVTILYLQESSNADLVYAATKVFAALPVPGGANTAHEIKGGHLDQLISLGHCAADVLFQSVQENETYQFSREHKFLLKNWESEDPRKRLRKSATLLKNCFGFLKGFLEKCPFRSVDIRPLDMIRLVFRILQVEPANLKEKGSVEMVELSFILSFLQSRAVSFLKTLVENKVCSSYMDLVEQQLVWTLKASSPSKSKAGGKDSSNQSLQQNISLRVLCYKTLTQVIKISRGNHTGLLEKILPTLQEDISPVKDSLTLNNAVRGGRLSLVHVKKKSQKKGYTVLPDETWASQSECSTSQIIEQRVPVTVAALDLVEAVFLHDYHSNPLKYIQILCNYIMDMLNSCNTGLFKEPLVRKSLFSALNAYVMCPHPLCPPPYAYIANTYQSELEDTHPMVAETCIRGLSIISFISANPCTANWSDVVRLRKECAKTKLKEDEPLLNNHSPTKEESDGNESEGWEDTHEAAEESDGDEADDGDAESSGDESEEGDVTENEGMNVTENGIDVEDVENDLDDEDEDIENDRDEDDIEIIENDLAVEDTENDLDNDDAEECVEDEEVTESDDFEDDSEDKTDESKGDRNTNKTANSGSNTEGTSDEGLEESSLAHKNGRNVEEDKTEDEPPVLKRKKKLGRKQPGSKNSKRLKKDSVPSVSEMLTAFVDSGPDSDSD